MSARNVRGSTRALFGSALMLVAVAGCGGGGEPQVKVEPEVRVGLTLVGDDRLNTCGGEFSNALVVRVLQLTSEAAISISSLDKLAASQSEELGDELIAAEEVVLSPGGRLQIDILVKPELQFVAVVGNFCETKGDCWRWVRPVADLTGPTVLAFGEFCIQEADGE